MHRSIALSAALALGMAGLSSDLAPGTYAQFLEPDVKILYTLHAEAAGDRFGWAGEAIGDLNRDGASEFVIGAIRNGAGGTLAGRAYVYSGRDGSLMNMVTGSPFNRLGFGVAGVGDVNKDGVPDYAVSGPGVFQGPPPQFGRLLVISGADHTVLYDRGGAAGSFFGYDVNAAGDVNGDTYPDIIVGEPLASVGLPFSGQVRVISGRDGSIVWAQQGPSDGAFLGTGVSGVADLNGDGLPEQAVGASGAGPHGTGQAFVLAAPDGAYLRTLKPTSSSALDFGDFFVHDAGDVDGDGVSDIFIADVFDTRLGDATGRAYVFSGTSAEKLRIFNGENAGDGFGIGRGAGDLDGDGRTDFVIAAFTSSAGAEQGGKVYLYSGKTGRVLRTMTGTSAGHQLGFDALPLGDVDRDGITDFLITGADVAHVVAGRR